MTLVPGRQRQTQSFHRCRKKTADGRRIQRYPRKEHVRETHSATFLQTDVSVCARGAFTFTMACRRERSFRVFTIEIHERENKKKYVYALQTTWRNSGPRIAYSTSRRPNRDSRKDSMCVR